MTDQEIVDALNEAARYMRSDPAVSRELISLAVQSFPAGSTSGTHRLGHRLEQNLRRAAMYSQVEPDVSSGYCLGAAFEIQAAGKFVDS